jgi:hypothetical protein
MGKHHEYGMVSLITEIDRIQLQDTASPRKNLYQFETIRKRRLISQALAITVFVKYDVCPDFWYSGADPSARMNPTARSPRG